MLQYIKTLCKYATFAFLANDYFKNNYTEAYNTMITHGGFYLIHMYSKIQILCDKLPISLPIILIQLFNNSSRGSEVEFIQDGHVQFVGTKDEFVKKDIKCWNDIDYDFIIYSNYDEVNKITNKIIFTKIPDENDFNYTISNVKFVLVEVEMNNKIIKIDFKTDTYNYYIVDNVISEKFLEYFIKKYYPHEKIRFQQPFCEMKLKILDHNVEKQEFDSKTTLQINKDDYIKIELH